MVNLTELVTYSLDDFNALHAFMCEDGDGEYVKLKDVKELLNKSDNKLQAKIAEVCNAFDYAHSHTEFYAWFRTHNKEFRQLAAM